MKNVFEWIDGLIPLSAEGRATVERLNKEYEENTQRAGGLTTHPKPGCVHNWQSCRLNICNYGDDEMGYLEVNKCSKCHVLGDPPQ